MTGLIQLRKMKAAAGDTWQYSLEGIELNPLLGKNISIKVSGKINCINCQRSVKKTFMDGYCFVCFQKLARCDMCAVKPEVCHYHAGTCREPEWGKENCLIKHVVYLSNTTGLKVGITREHKKFERWADQGALETIVLAEVPERLISGKLEVVLAKAVSDKSDWRSLILGKNSEVDLVSERNRIAALVPDEFKDYLLDINTNLQTYKFSYPILQYPLKVKSHNFDKEPLLEGPLNGIRGQYLFIGEKAVNIRKYSGYEAEVKI